MRAEEARKLSKVYAELNMIFDLIKQHISGGNKTTCIKLHLHNNDVKQSLKEMGYNVSDDIDEDSDYRGTWISW